MRRHVIYVYWLLLLLPTIAVGVGAYLALRREDARRRQAEQASHERLARERAAVFADQVRYSLQVTQREALYDLVRLPDGELPAALRQWEQHNPLVRNVFIWKPPLGLALPDPRQPRSREQTRFALRYEALFTGRGPWLAAAPPAPGGAIDNQPDAQTLAPPPAAPADGPPPPAAPGSWPPDGSAPQPQQAAATVPPAVAQQLAEVNLPAPGPANRSGWIPWYADNQLHLLGWVSSERDGTVRGVELELAAFVARLYQATPAELVPPGSGSGAGLTACALLDGAGRTVYAQGPALDPARALSATVPAGGDLPHWEVRCTYQPPPAASRGGSLLVFGMLLTGILMAAIVGGGSLLLWQARREAAAARRKTSFVANVSHELKTPLTSIRMYAELLTSRRVHDAAKQQNYLDIIVAECQRLTRLVNNVLDFSRLEQNRKKYHLETIPVAAFVADLLETHALRLQEAGLHTQCQPDASGTLAVRADRDALEQILTNLLDNACKYGQAGADLTVHLARAGATCRVSVMDRGPGVPPAHAARIFEKFHRVDDALSRQHEGVGLGLSIARRLARGQGGDLAYAPRPGGGACFTITLPIAEDT